MFAGFVGAFVSMLAACSHTTPQSTMEKLEPTQLAALINQEKDLFFLDVRDPSEIRELGTLPGYVNIPIEQLDQRLAEIPKDKIIVTA